MNSSRLVSLFLNVVDSRETWILKTLFKKRPEVQLCVCFLGGGRGEALLLPNDGVHAPDLGRALQNAEGLGEGLGLVRRSQCSPVTTATSKTAEVMQGNRRG